MKIIFTVVACLFLLTIIIDKLLLKFRPNRVHDNRWKLGGLIASFLFLIVMTFLFSKNPTSSNINKLVIPFAVFIVFFDIYRRSRHYK
ncbi:MAG: hypothetical protein WAT22_19540 [Saprospiraceae bacterium]